MVGDPAAPELLAGLGLDQVTLAAFYHATRALTPRHPQHRVVVAEHTAAYIPVEPWIPAQRWVGSADAFGEAAASLAAVGLPVHAWVVVAHVDSWPGANRVVNAYGDTYPWALCPSAPETVEYATRLAAAAASRRDVSGIEFEAAGWYGFDHLHEHDKVAGVALGETEQFLFSLCFCAACGREYQQSGIDPAWLRRAVRDTLDCTFHAALGPGLEMIDAVLDMRQRVAERLRDEIVREVRAYRPGDAFPILFHGNPRPHRSTAFTGLDPATLPPGTTGVVVNCWETAENVKLTAETARPGTNVLAGMLAVAGFGANPERTPRILDEARSAGASGIRIYHAGLAGSADLVAIRELASLAHAQGV